MGRCRWYVYPNSFFSRVVLIVRNKVMYMYLLEGHLWISSMGSSTTNEY